MKPSQHIPILVISALVFLGACGGYAYLYSRIGSDVTQEEALAAAAGEASAQDDRSRAASSLLAAASDDRFALASRVVSPDGVADFIARVESLGGKSGTKVTVASVALADDPDHSKHELLLITFSAQGSFSGVSRTLALLEGLPYPVTIEQAYVEKQISGSSKDGPWTGSFSITTPKQKKQ